MRGTHCSPAGAAAAGTCVGRRGQRGAGEGEPTYPWESTVSFALSSARDRTERSLRRIWGSLSGCRQLRRTGTSWGSASPRAGPGTEQPAPVPVEAGAPTRQGAAPARGRPPHMDVIIKEKSPSTFSPTHLITQSVNFHFLRFPKLLKIKAKQCIRHQQKSITKETMGFPECHARISGPSPPCAHARPTHTPPRTERESEETVR